MRHVASASRRFQVPVRESLNATIRPISSQEAGRRSTSAASRRSVTRPHRCRAMLQQAQSVARHPDAVRQAPPQLPRRHPRRNADPDPFRLDQHRLAADSVGTGDDVYPWPMCQDGRNSTSAVQSSPLVTSRRTSSARILDITFSTMTECGSWLASRHPGPPARWSQ